MTDSSEAEFEGWWNKNLWQDESKDAARAAWSACAEKAAGVADEVEQQQENDYGAANSGGAGAAAAEIRRRLGGGK